MARKYGTNSEVIEAYVKGEEKPCRNGPNSVSHRNGVLYSYNEPICIRQGEREIHKDDGMYIVNGDKWTNTTSQHQSELQAELRVLNRNHFTTSFSALENFAGRVSPDSIAFSKNRFVENVKNNVKIVDHTSDFIAQYDQRTDKFFQAGKPVEWSELPKGVEIRYRKDELTGIVTPVMAHMAGSVLFELNGEYALASMDEMQYFLSILPRPAASVSDAFFSLKPQEAVDAQARGLEVFRQGEWFFIPHLIDKEAREVYNQMPTDFKLVGKNGGNPHVATRGQWIREGVAEVSGMVRHPEHTMLRLSTRDNPTVFVAVENTAKQSFSAQGQVD